LSEGLGAPTEFRRVFSAPAKNAIKLKLTGYQGENHPGSSKAVLYFSPKTSLPHGHLPQVMHKFKVLAGPRYDSTTDTLTISCDTFASQEENAKWCSDTLDKLLSEAKDLSNPMSDIPVDPRPVQARQGRRTARLKRVTLADFPKQWLVDPQARAQAKRQAALDEVKQLDEARQLDEPSREGSA
jgi:small subunit ribosomal protein S35